MRYVSIKAVNMNFVLCSAQEPGVSRSLVRNLRDCQLDCDNFNEIVILNRSNFRLKRIRIPEENELLLVGCGILEIFFNCGIRNPGFWNLESSSRNPESHYRLEFRIHFLLTKKPKSSTCNLESAEWNSESKTVLDQLTWGEKLLTLQTPLLACCIRHFGARQLQHLVTECW